MGHPVHLIKNSAKFLQELYFAATPLELMRYKEDWKRILREHNLKMRQYDNSNSDNLGIFIGVGVGVTFIVSLFCVVMGCACKNSMPPPNVVPMNQLRHPRP